MNKRYITPAENSSPLPAVPLKPQNRAIYSEGSKLRQLWDTQNMKSTTEQWYGQLGSDYTMTDVYPDYTGS